MGIADFQNDQFIVINDKLITQGYELEVDTLFDCVTIHGYEFYAWPLIMADDGETDFDLFEEALLFVVNTTPRGPAFFTDPLDPVKLKVSLAEARNPNGIRAERVWENGVGRYERRHEM
jgi:hypothetical protein